MLCIIMPVFATSALLTIIVGIANMATTRPLDCPRSNHLLARRRLHLPSRELTTRTISTNNKMGKSSYVCKIMQYKNDFAAIWCVKQYHPNQDTFLHPLHIKIMDTLEFCKAGLLTVVNNHDHGVENTTALNSQDGYPCTLIIACPDEKTHESQIESLTKEKEVRIKVEQSFCNCLLSFSHPY
jgi:hypothetical protein